MDSLNVALLAIQYALDNQYRWDSRIHFDNVPPRDAYPFIWVVFGGGGERNEDLHADPLYTLSVTASSKNMQEALDCKARIHALLNDRGAHDRFPAIRGMNGWVIRTITAGAELWLPDPIDDASRVYRAGYTFFFNMEATNG